jgi:hypothetical protein
MAGAEIGKKAKDPRVPLDRMVFRAPGYTTAPTRALAFTGLLILGHRLQVFPPGVV